MFRWFLKLKTYKAMLLKAISRLLIQSVDEHGTNTQLIISIGTFDVFKYDERVVDYPVSLIEEVKQLIKEEIR